MKDACPICEVFKKVDWHIENSPDNPHRQTFPEQFNQLTVYQDGVGRFGDETLLRCPKCGTCFLYKKWLPGGSDDALRNWIHERIYVVSEMEARELVKGVDKYTAAAATARCPKCRTTNVRSIDGVFVGSDVFIKMRCYNCGNVDTVDEYQLDEWYG